MTRSTSKKSTKFFAIFMAVVLLAMCIPTNVFGTSNELPHQNATETQEGVISDASIVDGGVTVNTDIIGEYVEDISKREENVKHFANPDGTYTAIVYPTAVHRKDADGVWQDINNDLALTTVKGSEKYASADSRVSFASRFAPSAELMTLSENGYSISMSLISDSKNDLTLNTETQSFGLASVTNAAKKELPKTDVKLEDVARVDNRSSIVYNNIRANTDIEYILDGNDVKENIIVRAPLSSYEYAFDLRLDGLVAILNENGSIVIYDAETEEAKYQIPAPYMYDASGAVSYAVEYTLIAVSSGRYLLMVTADKSWINAEGREFPVTIDPTVEPLEPKIATSDTYISYSNPNEAYFASPNLCVCYNCTALINLYLPNLPADSSFISANMHFKYYFETYQPDYSEIGVYQITNSWSEEFATYNNAPNISSTQIDTVGLYVDERPAYELGSSYFNVSELVEDWYYNDVPNYGVAVKFESGIYAVKLKSYDSGVDNYEYLSVNYAYEFEEGVYAFKSVIYENEWMTNAQGVLQHAYLTQSPMDSFIDDQSDDIRIKLFKITQQESTGQYVIRSMVDNRNVLTFINNQFVFINLPISDESVPIGHTFYIYEGEWGLLIRHSLASDKYIGIDPAYTYNLGEYSIGESFGGVYWDYEEYEASEYGHFTDFEIDNTLFRLEEEYEIMPQYWSTIPKLNVPKIELRNSSIYDTEDIDWGWNDDTGSMEITFNIRGTFYFDWEIGGNGWKYGNVTVKSFPKIPDDANVQKTLDIKIYYDSSVANNDTNYEYTHDEIVTLFEGVNWYFYKEFGFRFNLVECEYSAVLEVPGSCNSGVCDTGCDSGQCGNDNSCEELHHKSSVRLLNLLQSSGDEYVLRLVGYGLCNISARTHSNVLGTAYVIDGARDSVCSTMASKGAIENVIIHELSHNFGVSHCISDNCIMNKSVDTDITASTDSSLGNWCTNCKKEILDTVYPQEELQ